MKPSSFSVWCLSAFCLLAIFSQFEKAQARHLINQPESTFHKAVTEETEKSKIFIIGGTGKFGRYVVNASVEAGHETVALVRENTIINDPEKAALVETFKSIGVAIVYGDINFDHDVLVSTIKQVDVVISCVGGTQAPDQINLTSAITEAGNIKRFFPSEYAIDVDRLHDPVEPAKSLFEGKANIRRVVEAAGIPYTYVVANGFASRFWPNLAQVTTDQLLPNITQVEAFGDGNSKITSTLDQEVAVYVIKTVDDPRTLNKILYLRPPANILSFNDLFALWESKSGTTLHKTYVTEEELLQRIEAAPYGLDILLSVCYSVAIKNDYASYEIDPSFGVEATELYPEVEYTTVDEYLNQFLIGESLSLLTSHQTKGLDFNLYAS